MIVARPPICIGKDLEGFAHDVELLRSKMWREDSQIGMELPSEPTKRLCMRREFTSTTRHWTVPSSVFSTTEAVSIVYSVTSSAHCNTRVVLRGGELGFGSRTLLISSKLAWWRTPSTRYGFGTSFIGFFTCSPSSNVPSHSNAPPLHCSGSFVSPSGFLHPQTFRLEWYLFLASPL